MNPLRGKKSSRLGSLASEDGVLKLVHPGRYVEIHRFPVTAAEIMKKNPRHSVTRQDVFEYPWVVVKPESVLHLGKVFFIVPNHTIYNLLKAHRERNQLSPNQNQSPNKHVSQQVQNQDSPIKSHAGSTPKHLTRHKQLSKSPPTTSCFRLPSLYQDHDLRTRKQKNVGSWPEITLNHKISHLRLENDPVEISRIMMRSSNHEEDHSTDANITVERKDGDLEFRHSTDVTMLKSCLRKPDSVRKLLQLKVSFFLPAKDEEQHQRRVESVSRRVCRQ